MVISLPQGGETWSGSRHIWPSTGTTFLLFSLRYAVGLFSLRANPGRYRPAWDPLFIREQEDLFLSVKSPSTRRLQTPGIRILFPPLSPRMTVQQDLLLLRKPAHRPVLDCR